MTNELSDRQARLLTLAVREFVETAQPVASNTLVRRYRLAISSATVRNELANLEEMGLLMHPHTSAGRVPTITGYRYFVEHLMTCIQLTPREQRLIRQQYLEAGLDPERWLHLSAALIAKSSGAVGVVAAERDASPVPLLVHAGLAQIVYQPEFASHDRLHDVLEFIEDGAALMPLLSSLPASGVSVMIGGEPPLEHLPFVTLVLARYGEPSRNRTTGVVGVVGSNRLPYERTVPTVGYVANLMTELLREAV